MMYVHNTDEGEAPVTEKDESYAMGYATGYSDAQAYFQRKAATAATKFGCDLAHRFCSVLNDYAETDNRVEIEVIKDEFFQCLQDATGCVIEVDAK